jgi:tripartite-type tricarboxylate transporter receptor subunit TctC
MGVARLVLWAIAAALSSAAVPVCAQSQYPVRSIRLIVPFAPGGATDILARMVSQKLNEAWGQQVIVDNRAGGNTVIGTDVAAKAAPDGYTLVMVSTSTTTTPSLMRKLPYDPLRDLAPVIMLVSTPNVLATHPSVPARSVGELIAIARARPGQVAYGSGGSGASTHLGGEILRLMGGVDMVHVPYKGTGPATIALLSGEVSWMFGAILPTLPFIKAGRLRAIAVSSVKRAAVLPEVPPVADTLPGFETSPWTGISAPAATPREVVVRLNQEIARAFTAADTRERLAREGNDVVANSPEEFDAFFRGEVRKWAKVIRDAGIRLE